MLSSGRFFATAGADRKIKIWEVSKGTTAELKSTLTGSNAAVMSLVLEALPAIAAEVAAPLAKTEEIVLIGGNNNTTNEINKLVGTLPPAIQALTGVDITGALGKIPGATMVK